MTPSRPHKNRLAVVAGVCIAGMLLVPLAQHPAMASSELVPPAHATEVNLRLDRTGATRVLAETTGAAQEDDSQNPKSMEEQANQPVFVKRAPGSTAAKKEVPVKDRFAFVKDWPFWVIAGGVLLAGIGGYVLLKNSNKEGPCAPQFTSGCFGAK